VSPAEEFSRAADCGHSQIGCSAIKAHIMNKKFRLVLVAFPFSHAVILFILGVCILLLPDIMRGLNVTLPYSLTIFFRGEGLLLTTTSFIALCMHGVFICLMKKKELSENHEQHDQKQ
jgi:hypothetical protein